MVVRVQKTSDGHYALVLTPEILQELKLEEGSPVEIKPLEAREGKLRPEIRYASPEQVRAAFKETLPDHEWTYRELAK